MTRRTPTTEAALVDGIPVITDPSVAARGLSKDSVIGIDTETTGFSPWRNQIALIQLYGEDTNTLAVIQVKDGVVPKPIMDLFTSGKTFVVHNGVGFDLLFLDRHRVPWKNAKWHDTLVGETVLAGTGRRDISVSLRGSLRRRLGKNVDKDIEHGHWDAPVLSTEQIIYAAQDVISLPALYRAQLEKAKGSKETEALEMEMELAPYVAQMTLNGLPLPEEVLLEYLKDQAESIKDAETRLRKVFGKDINLNSTKQLQTAFQGIGIPIHSTSVETLVPIVQSGSGPGVELIEQLLLWKHGAQRIKMYNPAWMAEHVIDDWVHPKFWQCSADTTRFTCSNPNLQQVPKDSRHIIGHIPGLKIVSPDYSQIEVRIAAKLAQDETLLSALENEDIHRAIAAEVYGKKMKDVSDQERKYAKALSFTLLFGGGASTLHNHAQMSGGNMTFDQAEKLSARFFARFKGLARMRDRAISIAQSPGPAFIRLPNSNRRILVGQTKRASVILNTMVQGTAAVGIKYGMLEAGRRGLMKYVGAQVHDELVAAVPTKEAEEYAKELSDAMVVGMKVAIDTTIKVEAKIGDVWQA